MEKLTDNEIIKALECCMYGHGCEDCPYIGKGFCNDKLKIDALNLINRQQAEIAELQRKNSELEIEFKAMRNAANLYKAEVERLQEERDFYKAPSALLAKGIEEVKSEAIKEFAERLTDRADLLKISGLDYRWAIWQDDIDNLVKEMTEVSK